MTSPLTLTLGMSMAEKVQFIWPEIVLFLTTCAVMIIGLSRAHSTRRITAGIAGIGLIVAGVLAFATPPAPGLLPHLMPFAKVLIAGVGLLMLMLLVGTVDREEESLIAQKRIAYNPLRANRAEFYAFFLFSLTGLMLCASADDLIWLFLALELTSLPTYIMVTVSQTGRRGSRAQEAGVKYFFLGALGAAMFLYGFALLYGGTGSTSLLGIRDILATQAATGGINTIALLGILLSILGIGFKIAAVPMHLYTPDVYEGAAAPVSAFLAFTPKTAGFIALILICSTVGWHFSDGPGEGSLPELVRLTLWVMAALTMTWGNVLAVLQNNVKRMLAYSSIAHSGYMLVGLVAGPGDGPFFSNGLAAVMFYLLSYGVMNLGAFAVLAALERRGSDGETAEIETVADLRGLCRTHPVLGWTMVLCSLSLLGLPPLLGFFGKVPLFTSAISAGEIGLVVVLGLNSAIAAYYYLRLAFAAYLDEPDPALRPATPTPYASRVSAGILSAAGVVVLIFVAGYLMDASGRAVSGARPDLASPPLAPVGEPHSASDMPGDTGHMPAPAAPTAAPIAGR